MFLYDISYHFLAQVSDRLVRMCAISCSQTNHWLLILLPMALKRTQSEGKKGVWPDIYNNAYVIVIMFCHYGEKKKLWEAGYNSATAASVADRHACDQQHRYLLNSYIEKSC